MFSVRQDKRRLNGFQSRIEYGAWGVVHGTVCGHKAEISAIDNKVRYLE